MVSQLSRRGGGSQPLQVRQGDDPTSLQVRLGCVLRLVVATLVAEEALSVQAYRISVIEKLYT